jgi:DNA-binding transcriptional MerR regulator
VDQASEMHRTAEFAQMAGVTVRALHHYDRLGLLKPRRTRAGYRLYGSRDFERLEQIVALKFLGIPLKQIQKLLDRDRLALPDALRAQRKTLEARRRMLEHAITAIRNAEALLAEGQHPGPAVLQKIIEVLEMQDNVDWAEKYYSAEAREKIESREQHWSPELQEKVTQQWNDLFRDIEAALGEDPAGEKAQALAARWKELVAGFTVGDRGIAEGLNRLYADQQNWPAAVQEQMRPFLRKEVWDFIRQAMNCKT